MRIFLIVICLLWLIPGCKPTDPGSGTTGGTADSSTTKPKQMVVTSFDADSAYLYVQQQVDFGPRVPGTDAHGRCAKYLLEKLSQYCDTSFFQEGEVRMDDGTFNPVKNVLGIFNPEAKKRVMLAAHYDTRPHADEDPFEPQKTADGANDGASGVGVLIEIAR